MDITFKFQYDMVLGTKLCIQIHAAVTFVILA